MQVLGEELGSSAARRVVFLIMNNFKGKGEVEKSYGI